jgi:site-specific recombinase XerD
VLRVHGKRGKSRDLPIPSEVADALGAWRDRHRARIFGVDEALLFPRLGSRRRDGRYPEAGGRLSGRALGFIVAPIMRAAGVPAHLCHPHVLRHTYGSLFMRRPGAQLDRLRALMGHASIATTAVYVHHTRDDREQAVLANHPHRQLPAPNSAGASAALFADVAARGAAGPPR